MATSSESAPDPPPSSSGSQGNSSQASNTSTTNKELPLGTKLAIGIGESVNTLGVNLPNNLAFPIFNIILGVNPTLLGLAMMLPRLWDGVTDPVVGALSDNTRSRWGRRRPYMLVGGILTAMAVMLLCWFPRGMHEVLGEGEWMGFSHDDLFYAGYLLIASVLFYTCMTIFAVPFGALALELTPDYAGRTRLMSYRTFFSNLSSILLGWTLAIAEWDIFRDTTTGEPDTLIGARYVGLLLLVILLVSALVPTFFVKEPFSVQHRSQPKFSFWKGLKETLSNVPFLLITLSYIVAFVGLVTVMGLGLYVAIYHVFSGDRDAATVMQGWAHTAAVVVGLVSAVVINRLSDRLEKKTILIGSLGIASLGGLLSWSLYTPEVPWLMILPYAMIYPGITGLLIISASMVADVCDIDELEHGGRREGLFWSVMSWIQKMAMSVALLMSGLIFDLIGYDADLPMQSEEVIFRLRLAYGGVVFGTMLFSALIVLFIPLNKSRMEAVRRELDRVNSLPGGSSV